MFPEIQEISDANSIKLIALGSHGSLDCYQVEFVVAGEVQTGWVSTVDVNPTSERDLDEETLPSMAINDGSDNNRLSVNEDSQLEIDIFENDYGPLNRGSLSISSSPSNGTLQENSESGIITYVPDANYYGNDQFRYQVQGENGESSSATVYISVEPVNDAPIITNDGASFTVAENSNSVRDFIVNATDADGDELTFTIVDGNTNNAFSINESNGQIQVNNPSALDYEEIRKFDLKIIVSDGEASTEGDLSILVENLVETVLVTIHFDSVFLSFDHQFDYAKFKFDVDIGNLNLFDSLRSFPQNGAANNGTIYWERFQTKYFDDYNNEDYNTYSYSLKEDQVFFIHGHGYLSTRDFSPLFIGSFWKGYALSDLVSGTYDETIEITCNELSTCESDSANYIIKYTITVDWQ